MDRPTVFISYSRKDEAWKEKLQVHLRGLENAEHITLWDDEKLRAGELWFEEIKEAIDNAALAVCLLTPNFLASGFCTREEVPYLLSRRERNQLTILPVLIEDCGWEAFEWIAESQRLPSDGSTIKSHDETGQNKALLDVTKKIQSILDDPNYTPPLPSPSKWPPPKKVDISHLPISGAELFGRKKELKWLDEQWISDTTRITSLIAWGGVGKSTLVNRWLKHMAEDNYRGAGRVFGWSFYSQGTRESVASADQFIQEALTWFGDDDPSSGSSWNKGQRLARLMLKTNALLILDGMEPLQVSNEIEKGKIKDPALATLLRELALHKGEGSGLCLITSRLHVEDLLEFPLACPSRELEKLSTGAGRALLRVGGVKGSDADLEAATENLGHHALSLKLLAGYLLGQSGHHIKLADELPQLEHIQDSKERYARRVITAFEHSLGEGQELALLRLLGFFDRPIEKGPMEALLAEPAIPMLTEPLQGLSFDDLLRPLSQLRQLGLIAGIHRNQPDSIDAHPILRDHFQAWLQNEQPEAWQEGNSRLFNHYQENSHQITLTLEDLTPIFLAISHGCAAKQYEEALSIYWSDIQKETKHFCTRKLGAFGSDLSALAGFFEHHWDQPVSSLSDAHLGFVLLNAGFNLRALGRLTEAVAPLTVGLNIQIKMGFLNKAARSAGRLSKLKLLLGSIREALLHAKQAVKLAQQSKSIEEQISSQTKLAEVLVQSNRLKEAETLFLKAEALQNIIPPESHLYNTYWGYRYSELLLEQGHYHRVKERANAAIRLTQRDNLRLDTAFCHLHLSLCSQMKNGAEEKTDLDLATYHLNEAVENIMLAGRQDHFPRFFIARAAIFRLREEPTLAQLDLDEAFRFSMRSRMLLFEVDAHIEQAQLFIQLGDIKAAKLHLSQASKIAQETAYKRSIKVIKALEKSLKPNTRRIPAISHLTQDQLLELIFLLVTNREAPPELLLDINHHSFWEHLKSLGEDGALAFQASQCLSQLKEQHRGVEPNPLWLSWIESTQARSIEQQIDRINA